MNANRLNNHDRSTLHRIFAHPLAHNIEWLDVEHMVRRLGTVSEGRSGEVSYEVGGFRETFRHPHRKEIAGEDIVRLRHLLAGAGVTEDSVSRANAPDIKSQTGASIVIIDHRGCRILTLAGTGRAIVRAEHFTPADSHGFRRHLEHRKEADYKGERIPEDVEYYERVSTALRPAREIVLIGDSVGKSSAINYLHERLNKHHPEIFRHIIGTIDADLSAITDNELGALATDFLAKQNSPA